MSKPISWKRVIFLTVICLSIFVGWFIWEIATDEPPQFFPLNNPQGEYRITKKCPGGQGWVEKPQLSDNGYCLEYKGPDVFLNDNHGNTNYFSITIGKSPIDLEAYVDKRVKNIKGKYTSSSKQCIQNKCIEIYGPLVVVDIDKLELAE